MIQFNTPFTELYRKTLFPESHLLFIADSKEPAEIAILNSPESVFSEPPGDMLQRVLPMAELDLSKISAHFREKLFFIYDESDSYQMIYRLTGDNRIENLVFTDESGEVKHVMEETEFEHGAEHNYSSVVNNEIRHFCIFRDRVLPEGIQFEGQYEFGKWIYEEWSATMDRSAALGSNRAPQYFGPWFKPTQGTIYPVMKNHPVPDFIYAGCFRADWLELCDFNYFLFFHPETRTVVQIRQFT